jgi:hypothetical protein
MRNMNYYKNIVTESFWQVTESLRQVLILR